MSETQTIGMATGGGAARDAIARASQKTGVDFRYLLAQAKIESSLDPSAKAPTSSAAGLYQFTHGTWLQTLDRHADSHGLSWAGDAITGGRITDPAMRSQIMALRYDADASSVMAAELARDNAADLSAFLGREPDAAELYLAHFLGTGGARQFLGVLSSSPGRNAASVLPRAAGANRAVFYERSGSPRSVAGVMDLICSKVASAMEEPGRVPSDPFDHPAATTAAARLADLRVGYAAAEGGEQAHTASMADTLRSAFGTGEHGSTTDVSGAVRKAYDKLARLGL